MQYQYTYFHCYVHLFYVVATPVSVYCCCIYGTVTIVCMYVMPVVGFSSCAEM